MNQATKILRALVAAGLNGEALFEAFDELVETAAEERPVSAGAQRTRRWRERKASQSVTKRHGDVTPVTVTSQASQSVTAKEIPPTPPKEKLSPSASFLFESPLPSEREERKKEFLVTRARSNPRASRLPEQWAPTEPDLQFAISALGALRAQSEREKFTDYWRAKAGKDAAKLDWSATWRNWIRRASEQTNGNRPSRQTNRQSLTELAFDIAERVRERERAAGIQGSDDFVRSH